MKNFLAIITLMVCVASFAGNPRQIYIGVVDTALNPYDFSAAPYDNVIFSGWITARPMEVQHELILGAYYETFGMGLSAVSLNIGDFATPWIAGDQLNMLMVDQGNGCYANWFWTLDNSGDPILVGLDDWLGAGTSTTAPTSPIPLSWSSIEEGSIPAETILCQNYPNPFNPTTTIKFDLARNSNVKLNVYNYNGQLVKSLVNRTMNAGSHSINFDASSLIAGVYYCTMEADGKSMTQKMILVK